MAGRSKKKPLSRRQGLARYLRELEVVDYRLIISIVFLCVFGLIMIYSASAAESGVSLVLKQFGIGAGGFVLMWIVSYVDYHIYEKIAGIIYIGAVLSMFLVKVPGLGVTRNGASRWIDIGPFSFQPSEFVKPAMVPYGSKTVDAESGYCAVDSRCDCGNGDSGCDQESEYGHDRSGYHCIYVFYCLSDEEDMAAYRSNRRGDRGWLAWLLSFCHCAEPYDDIDQHSDRGGQ